MSISKRTDDNENKNVDFAETSYIFDDHNSSIEKTIVHCIVKYSTNMLNSVPLDLHFCLTEKSYSILVRKNVLDKMIYNINARIKLPSVGKVDKIILTDYPLGQYILSFNGFNVATAKFDINNQVFDLANSNSVMFNQFKQLTGGEITDTN